jgi:hypothetical protein
MWSNDPWETPIVKIKSKHIIDEILKLVYLNSKIPKIFTKKKKINERFRFIFFILLFISN